MGAAAGRHATATLDATPSSVKQIVGKANSLILLVEPGTAHLVSRTVPHCQLFLEK